MMGLYQACCTTFKHSTNVTQQWKAILTSTFEVTALHKCVYYYYYYYHHNIRFAKVQITWLVVTEVWSKSFRLVTERRHKIGVLCAVTHIFAYWMSPVSVTQVIFFIVECGIAQFLCAICPLWVFSMFRHHPHPLGYPCAKFRFCCALHCWVSSRRKIAYSITHSIIRLIWFAGNRSFCFGTSDIHFNNTSTLVMNGTNKKWENKNCYTQRNLYRRMLQYYV